MNVVFDRRQLLAMTGWSVVSPAVARAAPARKAATLELVPRTIVLRPGGPPVAAWRFASDDVPRFAQGDIVDATVVNRLPVGVSIGWRGLAESPELEPLLARAPIPPGGSDVFALNLRHAGTLLCDARYSRETAALSFPVLPVVVEERARFAADHDEVLLIEEWRPAGADTPAILTVNGRPDWRLAAQTGERLRLRVINGSQAAVLSVQFEGLDVRVMAIDSQPAEPFLARDGRLVLAPGTRIDVVTDVAEARTFVVRCGEMRLGEIAVSGAASGVFDAVKPLSSNGLPERIELQSALRVDLALDPKSADKTPLFAVKRGRSVVLALSNPLETAQNFQLRGHPLRLLDRLDDGWKPFWLDTLVIPGKMTIRVAFAATTAGAYLIAIMGDGTSYRSYLVEL